MTEGLVFPEVLWELELAVSTFKAPQRGLHHPCGHHALQQCRTERHPAAEELSRRETWKEAGAPCPPPLTQRRRRVNAALPSPGEPTRVKRFRHHALPPELGNDLGSGLPLREGLSPWARLALVRGEQRLLLPVRAACCGPLRPALGLSQSQGASAFPWLVFFLTGWLRLEGASRVHLVQLPCASSTMPRPAPVGF